MSIGILRSILLTLTVAGALALTAPDASLGGLGVAIAVGILLLTAAALDTPAIHVRGRAHPWRAIDPSRLLDQSNPDAEGHSRPRAPGVAALAATR